MSKKATQPPRLELVGEVISTYTRAQALEDGVLIDAGSLAQEAGYRWPVALTTAAWEDCVAWSEADNARQVHQDEAGRLWDVLYMGVLRPAHPRGRRRLAQLPDLSRPAGWALETGEAHQPEDDGWARRRRGAGHHDPAPERGLKRAGTARLFPLAIYGPIPVCKEQYAWARDGLLPYIRPVVEELAPLALMEYARFALNHLDGLDGP